MNSAANTAYAEERESHDTPSLRLTVATISSSVADDTYAVWVVRTVIVAVAGALAWYTWGHWGDLQIDSGREMYVPASILQGKLLYRDLWYMYGPLAPYVQALVFRIFGVSLNVLYGLGLTLTISCALLIFEIGRMFDLKAAAAAAPSIFFLAESFNPFIFNFVLPYSYAASMGCVLGLTCLYFALRHARTGRTRELAVAAVFAGLTVLAKQEFGLACLVVIGFEATASSILQRSFRAWVRNSLVSLIGLSPAIAVYGWFIWKVSAKSLFVVNWIQTPGTFFMRTFGARTTALQGFRFVPQEWLLAFGSAALSMGLWFAIAFLNCVVIRKLRVRKPSLIAGVVLGDIFVALFILGLVPHSETLPLLLAQAIFPKGLYVLGCCFLFQALWKVWHSPDHRLALADAALGLYAIGVSVRVMMELTPSRFHYATFFNPPLFIVFVLLISQVIRAASRSMDRKSQDILIVLMIGAQATLLLVGFCPRPKLLPARLKTDLGTIYTKPDMAAVFPQVISFMKTRTRNHKDFVVVPSAPGLYFFAGMQAPTRWYTAEPGVISPEDQRELANDIATNRVEFVLIHNRPVREFGIAGFGLGYNQVIYQWLMAHYTKVGQFGPIDRRPDSFQVEVYQRNAQ